MIHFWYKTPQIDTFSGESILHSLLLKWDPRDCLADNAGAAEILIITI